MTTAKSFRERKRQNKQAWRAANPGLLYSDSASFVGVDGEGGTTLTGKHDYFMLRAGEQCITAEGHLGSLACLSFLADLPRKAIYVSYFFDYDVTKICEDLPEEKLRRLINRESRMPNREGSARAKSSTPFPVDVHGGAFQIDYLPRKFFKVRRRLLPATETTKAVYGPWITVNDVGSFFQCSFVEFLRRWKIGTPAQVDAIAVGKEGRSKFDASDMPNIDKYNHLECRLLAEGMEEFRNVCKRSGYVPRAWQGPGQIAEAVMRARGIPKSREVPLLQDPAYEGLLQHAANAFYGGRPEITTLGPVTVPVYQWDINSAYPYAMLYLPCLIHGRWTRGPEPTSDLYISYGHFKAHEGTACRLFGFPVRRKEGSIYYPREGRGWYWSMEVTAARHQDFTHEDVWSYHKECECIPFWFVPELYAMRKRLGKDALGLYLKLALNSLYGKMAQSIGSPAYANPIWASFITSFTRAQIQDLIHKGPGHRAGHCGKEVLMIATDAIFTTAKLPVAESTELGGYGLTEHPDGLLLVQPGLYFTGNGTKPKTRGVPQTALADKEDEFLAAWQAMLKSGKEEDGVVFVPLTVFIGLRQALHRNKPALAGTWVEYKEDGERNGKRIGFEWRTKREVMERPLWGWGPATTYAYVGGPDIVTVPYSKEIGRWREGLRIDLEDQPDWMPVIGYEGGQ